MNVVFVTGNSEKAANFAKQMGAGIPHQAIELDEIQTLDATELVTHKVKQAYEQICKPVLVEDVSFVYEAWGELPGPFVKYFVQNGDDAGEKMCRMLGERNMKAGNRLEQMRLLAGRAVERGRNGRCRRLGGDPGEDHNWQ